MKPHSLQWGGRFSAPPDPALLAFGSSLEADLVLATFDTACSHAHVEALLGGHVIDAAQASDLHGALALIELEIADGSFAELARANGAEDIHGAIDERVRALAPEAGEWLHAGRSRNDQVATTLALFARARAKAGANRAIGIARYLSALAAKEASRGTMLASVTHWQPAQPVLLAFWLLAAAEPFVRAARRFATAADNTKRSCPLGSGAVAGSTLPLDRWASAKYLGFDAPSRNAMDSIGTRDVLLDVAEAYVRVALDASRIASELVIWATPAYGYVKIGDASSTGSSLMPQKRNPDVLELVRGGAADVLGSFSGALASLAGLPLSYHRDLQQTKAMGLQTIVRADALLNAFDIALRDVTFEGEAMSARAGDGYAVATDLADALILAGISARRAHGLVGSVVRTAESEARVLDTRDLATLASEAGLSSLHAPLDARASVQAKVTIGSTSPNAVREALESIEAEVAEIEASL